MPTILCILACQLYWTDKVCNLNLLSKHGNTVQACQPANYRPHSAQRTTHFFWCTVKNRIEAPERGSQRFTKDVAFLGPIFLPYAASPATFFRMLNLTFFYISS